MSAFANRKLKQAQELLQTGNPAGARQLCEQVLERAPRNPEALCLLGIALLLEGDAKRALPLLEQATSIQSGYGLALEYCGLALLMLGRYADAERVLREAANMAGAPPSVHMRLGISLLRQNRHQDALSPLQAALRAAPDDADCRLNLAHAYAQSGELDAAQIQLEAILAADPSHIEARFNLGVLALQRRDLDAARQLFEAVIERAPRYVDALVNLGVVLQEQGRPDDAARYIRKALEIDPGHAIANKNLGDVLLSTGELEEAREHYLLAVQSTPGFMDAKEGLATACLALGRFGEAVSALREVLVIDPEHTAALGALADALFQDGDLAGAEAAARRAIEIDGAVPGPYSALAMTQIVQGNLGDAVASLRTGVDRTASGGLLGMLAHQLRRTCDWGAHRPVWTELKGRLGHETGLGSPFWLLIEDTTPDEQLHYARRWADARFRNVPSGGAAQPLRAGKRPDRRLRVGYFSSEFHDHAIAHLFAGVLEHHDRGRFEIHAYSYGPDSTGAMRERLRAGAEHFFDIARDPDDRIIDRIRNDALDILVDLKGYTMGARTAILARRPCPVQVNWLGYPGTMGAPFIDYLITDRFTVPHETTGAYSETIVYLDHCWQCNDRKRPLPEPLTRSEYGLPDRAFVFCSFAQTAKISPEIFARWMALLRDVPAGVLWLAEDNRWATDNLRQAARSAGIASERIVIAPRVAFPQYLARYRVADLALDTFPYTSHSTASDALWAGCPLVALCGETFAARVSSSILTHAELDGLVTYTMDDYEQLARRLATDAALHAEVRSKVAAARGSALFDVESFTRDLERVYREIGNS